MKINHYIIKTKSILCGCSALQFVVYVFAILIIVIDIASASETKNYKQFFVTASGGWGAVGVDHKSSGVFTPTIGYFFTKNITSEFRYLYSHSLENKIEKEGSSYLGLLKYNHELFYGIKAGAGIGLGIGSTVNNDLSTGKTIRKSFGIFAIPVSVSAPTGLIDNMDYLITYLHVISFDNVHSDYVAAGLSYSFG